MHKSKLIKLLKTLNKSEFRQLGKFLRSPFFNSNNDIIRLYDYLKDNDHHPNFNATILTKEYVDKKIFYKEVEVYKFKARRIRDCMSDFSILVQEFMIVSETQNEENNLRDILFLKSLYRRNIHDIFETKTRETITKLEQQPFRDINFYKLMFTLKHDYFFHPDTAKLKISSKQINEVMNNLDLFYTLTKLRLSCEIRSREKILSEQYDVELIHEVIDLAEQKYAIDNHLFSIYAKILHLFTNGFDQGIYQEVTLLYFDNLQKIGKEEQKIILHYLINIMYSAVSIGLKNIEEVLNLYKAGLQYEILILNGRITPESFSNIAILGSKLEAFDWTATFISSYKQYLDESIRMDTESISLAYCHFNKKEYDETLNLILEQDIPGRLFHIRTRALIIRTYLEKFLLDNSFYKLLASNTDSFRKQVQRSDLISEDKKTSYQNFIKYTNQIAKLVWNKPNTFEKRVQRIKTDLQKEVTIVARSWLLDKVKSLEKK